MSRQLTDAQAARVADTESPIHASRPAMCMAWDWTGEETLIGLTGQVIFDSVPYGEAFTTLGSVVLRSLPNDRGASLDLVATQENIAHLYNGSWRDGAVKIWALPGDIGQTEFTADEGILLLDGKIASANFSGGKIVVRCVHVDLDGNFSPRNIVEEIATDLSPPGSILSWEGSDLVLEGVQK